MAIFDTMSCHLQKTCMKICQKIVIYGTKTGWVNDYTIKFLMRFISFNICYASLILKHKFCISTLLLFRSVFGLDSYLFVRWMNTAAHNSLWAATDGIRRHDSWSLEIMTRNRNLHSTDGLQWHSMKQNVSFVSWDENMEK